MAGETKEKMPGVEEQDSSPPVEQQKEGFLGKFKGSGAALILKLARKPRHVMLPMGSGSQREATGYGSRYTEVPELEGDELEEVDFFPVVEPFSFARIVYNNVTSEYLYICIEPHITEKEKELIALIKDTLVRTLGYDWEEMGRSDKKSYLLESVNSFIESRSIHVDPIMREKVNYYIERDYVGYGPIDVLMNDPQIEDVSCDGVKVPLFVFHQKYESIKTNIMWEEKDELDSFVVGVGQRCGKQISVANPILDGTTYEGHRVQATYSFEITTRGSTFTIRRFKEKPFTHVDLINFKSASSEMVAYIWVAVEQGESGMIIGGPACGKTATLNACMLFCPPTSKIISMEDTREINLYHENWIPGVTRTGSGERGSDGKAAGEVDMFDLVRAALRQRPNYIMVGEVRGKETYTMFQAMATGHTTYSTMHADSVKGMVSRLENPPISCPRILLSALNFVVLEGLVRVGNSEVRRIKQVVEIVGFEPETNELITNTVFEWDQRTDDFHYKGHSFLFDKIMEMKNMTHEEMMSEYRRRVDVIRYTVEKNVQEFDELVSHIVAYYKAPQETIAKIRDEMGWHEEEQEGF